MRYLHGKCVSVAANVFGRPREWRPRLTLRLVLLVMRFDHQSLFSCPWKKNTGCKLNKWHKHKHVCISRGGATTTTAAYTTPQESLLFSSKRVVKSNPRGISMPPRSSGSCGTVTIICIKLGFLICALLYLNSFHF